MNTALAELIRHYATGASVLDTPTTGQLLAAIDKLYPNTLSAADKVDFMNDELRETSRELPIEGIFSFITVANNSIISLPVYIPVDGIMDPILITTVDTVIGSGTVFDEYHFARLSDGLSGHKYYRADFAGLNNIGIYPVPTVSGLIGMFIYEGKAQPLSAVALDTKPGIQGEWVNLLKWKCLQRIAQAGDSPDVEMANNYQAEYNELYDKMQMGMFRKRIHKHKPDGGNSWWRR